MEAVRRSHKNQRLPGRSCRCGASSAHGEDALARDAWIHAALARAQNCTRGLPPTCTAEAQDCALALAALLSACCCVCRALRFMELCLLRVLAICACNDSRPYPTALMTSLELLPAAALEERRRSGRQRWPLST